ncbi:MAG: glycogen debranching enzyme, partial [Planctomycetales bacterium]|nr:glycogen debranching enzyme [Planctomycetales bacterium]
GNNNAYCQDNEISWFDWALVEDNAELMQFVRSLIHFRKLEPSVRREEFLTGQAAKPGELPDVTWYDASGEAINWEQDDQTLICLLRGSRSENAPELAHRHVLILMNASPEHQEFVLPAKARSFDWRLLVDTAADSPQDVFPEADGPPLARRRKLKLAGRSLVACVADVKTTRRRAAGG